jgi:RNA polymerase sigma-70 factor (ECF subfamily)
LPISNLADESALANAAEESDTVVERSEIAEEAARARHHMQRLKPEERQVIELSVYEGLSQSQIAERMQVPLGTVKTHARRGLIRLRELLAGKHAEVAKGGAR